MLPEPTPPTELEILKAAVREAQDKFLILSGYLTDETARECALLTFNKMRVALGQAPWTFATTKDGVRIIEPNYGGKVELSYWKESEE